MVGHEIWQETLKHVQNENHTLGPGIWQEIVKNMKYEKQTICELDFCEKTENLGKSDTITV